MTYIDHIRSKCRDNRGISRLIVIMAIAVIALMIPIIWGICVNVRAQSQKRECDIAIGSAQRKLDDEYLLNPDMTEIEAEEAATSMIRSLTDTCPSGGRYIVVKKKDGSGYKIYCELHGSE